MNIYTSFWNKSEDKTNIAFVGNAKEPKNALNLAIQQVSAYYVKNLSYKVKENKLKELDLVADLTIDDEKTTDKITIYKVVLHDKENKFESRNFDIVVIKNNFIEDIENDLKSQKLVN